MEPLSGLITLIAAILVFVTAILEYNRHTLNKNISEMQKKIESMKLFISNVYYDLFEDTDIIFLGPRFQGKSSLVTTIARQWKSIQGMRATTSFEIFTWESPEFISQKNLNSDFSVDMENRTRARLNIYDYAGDDDMIFTALEQMSNSKKYIIVFVLSSIAESTPSSKYFNMTTVKKIKQYLSNSTSECLAPYIVFGADIDS